jgi:syntaxin 16
MATRNRTLIFRRYRDALKSVRVPSSYAAAAPSTGSSGGPVIELVNASLLNPNRSYAPLSTEDPGNWRSLSLSLSPRLVTEKLSAK